MTKETDDFLAAVLPAYLEGEIAIHNGDAAPRKALWSRAEPVTLFGAAISGRGWAELEATFDWLGRSFSDCTSYENELVAAGASGDLAYHVAIEHSAVSVDGTPTVYELRVTTVFRREDGQWRTVHRHADPHTPDRTLERALAGEHRP
jgi:ketosteroid isomerase-like protein